MKHSIFAFIILSFFTACNNTGNDTDETIAPPTRQEEATGTAPQQKPATTQTIPSFEFEDVEGNITNLTSLKGKKVFINIWATWCPPCRVEMPSIEKLYGKVDKEKVVFIMLSLDENYEMAKEFIKENQLDLPVHYPASNLPQMFNTGAIPNTFIFDEKGELIKMNMGMDDYDTDYYVQLLK